MIIIQQQRRWALDVDILGMPSQDNLIKMECTDCHRVGYYTYKNKRVKVRLELKKHCKFCKKHTMHKETK